MIVNFFIKNFKRLKLISYNNKIFNEYHNILQYCYIDNIFKSYFIHKIIGYL